MAFDLCYLRIGPAAADTQVEAIWGEGLVGHRLTVIVLDFRRRFLAGDFAARC
jgi:hypothetical protein